MQRRHKKFLWKKLFVGQRYCRTKDQKLLSGLPKLKGKMSKLRDVLSKLVLLKRITDGGLRPQLPKALGGLGQNPPKAERVFDKTSYFNAIEIHSSHAQSYLKELNF